MGATWTIETETVEEFRALESEGAPTASFSYNTCGVVAGFIGSALVETEDSFWSISAENVAEAAADLVAYADAVGEGSTWYTRALAVAEVCQAAARLGRGVYAA